MLHSFILLAQQPHMPTMDNMYWIMLVSRICHILGAIILAGGLFYIRFIVSPAAGACQEPDRCFGGPRGKWAMWVGIATLLLLASGLWNYVQFIKTYDLAKSYHMVLGIKMLAALAVFVLAALLAGRTHAAEAIRNKCGCWINVCLFLAIVAVVLGSFLRSYPHDRKAGASEPAKQVAPNNQPTG